MLHENEAADVERLLVVHDEQLAAVPKYRYLAAWDRRQRFVRGSGRSPIPTGVPREREHEPYYGAASAAVLRDTIETVRLKGSQQVFDGGTSGGMRLPVCLPGPCVVWDSVICSVPAAAPY